MKKKRELDQQLLIHPVSSSILRVHSDQQKEIQKEIAKLKQDQSKKGQHWRYFLPAG